MSIAVSRLAQELPGARIVGSPEARVSGITYDSRKVRPGDLFVCIRGFVHDGHEFAAAALERGARALLVERELPLDAPQIVVEDSRRAMGIAAARLFGDPSQELRVIGVTGTNGKTTTAFLIRDLLSHAGRRTGLIGTVVQDVGDRETPASRTTPEAADIHRLMREMVDRGCRACAMEVSSHGLVLHRTAGVAFDVGVFTNLTQDHFDFHGSIEDYLEAKLLLFRSLAPGESGVKANKAAIVNGDDPVAPRVAAASRVPVLTYGIRESNDLWASDVQVTATGASFVARWGATRVPVRLALTGRFNVYNALAALAVGLVEGVDLQQAAAGIEKTVVPGRFEPVHGGQEFAVIVDYAHTPDSLENVLKTARSLAEGRVICVFGAGGDRDRTKRPRMGDVAANLADYVVITSDNPRSEDPAEICRQVAEGARQRGGAPFEIVVDRREAIRRAVFMAERGDLVLIAGKGHETYQEIKGEKHHFDDREEALLAIRERM